MIDNNFKKTSFSIWLFPCQTYDVNSEHQIFIIYRL